MSNLVAGTVDTSCHCCHFHYHYSCWHYGHRYHTISFYPRTKTLTSLQWSQTLFDFFGDDENSAIYNYSRLGAEICICSSVRSFCVSCSVVFNSLQPHGLYLTRLLCPWNSPGKNAGVGCHSLLQGIFLTQGLNLCLFCLLHWQVGSLPLVPPGKFPWWLRW